MTPATDVVVVVLPLADKESAEAGSTESLDFEVLKGSLQNKANVLSALCGPSGPMVY